MPAISVSVGQHIQRGFTLIEALVTLVIFSILLAIGVPTMMTWTLATKAASATELYAEGIKMARQQALTHNAASRLVLSPNLSNHQLDWEVDICFPTAEVACSDTSGSWSQQSPGPAAANDPDPGTPFHSVFRSASGLPAAEVLQPLLSPSGSVSVYFTPLGWVGPSSQPALNMITFQPAAAYATSIRASAIVITLAGTALKCDPAIVAAGDSRKCTP
jgi:type IV fimbrial biogenesis protein FimT